MHFLDSRALIEGNVKKGGFLFHHRNRGVFRRSEFLLPAHSPQPETGSRRDRSLPPEIRGGPDRLGGQSHRRAAIGRRLVNMEGDVRRVVF
jgi:hypothetical protein